MIVIGMGRGGEVAPTVGPADGVRRLRHAGRVRARPTSSPVPNVAGMLLSGGASRRMGFAKAAVTVDGVMVAARVGGALLAVTAPVVEVGPGWSGLPAVLEDPPGAGPLVAVVAGAAALRAAGHGGPVVVCSCDLPLLDAGTVRLLADWPGDRSVVPVVGGRPQPLCARWSVRALATAGRLAATGERAVRAVMTQDDPVLIGEDAWSGAVPASAFSDVDTPADLARLGLRWEPPGPGQHASSAAPGVGPGAGQYHRP